MEPIDPNKNEPLTIPLRVVARLAKSLEVVPIQRKMGKQLPWLLVVNMLGSDDLALGLARLAQWSARQERGPELAPHGPCIKVLVVPPGPRNDRLFGPHPGGSMLFNAAGHN